MPVKVSLNKKAVLISENEELYGSFKRAFKTIANFELIRYSGEFKRKQNVVISIKEDNDIDSWLWSEFRTKKKALNPLIVIGTKDKSSFFNSNPVFTDYSKEHIYIQIPFDLMELLNAISKLKPIYDNVTRKLIVSDYSKGYEYKLITHDLKIIKGDQQTTIDNLIKVKEFYSSKGNSKIVKIINERIKGIQANDDWEQTALEIKQYLEERLERIK